MRISYKNIWQVIGMYIVALIVLSLMVFVIVSFSPGDPLQAYYGDRFEYMTDEQLLAARHKLGLDGNVFIQYMSWIERFLQGDMGFSLKYRMPVADMLGGFFVNTLLLGVLSYALTFSVAIGIAILCVYYEGTWIDKVISEVGTILFYLPAFWVSLLLLLVFNVNLGWLPGSGAYEPGQSTDIVDRLRHVILPVTSIVIAHGWYYAYIIRSKLLDETRKEYVLLAKMKGRTSFEVLIHHCLRNVWPSIFSIMAIGANHIIGGSYVIEAVFSYPGIGNLAVESAKLHDYNVLMIIVILTGAVVIGASFIAQSVSEHMDYRMKKGEGGVL